MQKRILGLVAALLSICLPGYSQLTPPSTYFDLTGWKLQIPGPTEVKSVEGYASHYFLLTPEKEICFNLDASEKGHTKNSKYVRSELRHLSNWNIQENHGISATIKVCSDLKVFQVTVVQIHGITDSNENAPVLLRVAVVSNNLYAFLKSDSAGIHTDKVLLKSNVANDFFKVDVKNENHTLTIFIDGKEILARDLTYWHYRNYFKLGCYPQELAGKFQIYVKDMAVY